MDEAITADLEKQYRQAAQLFNDYQTEPAERLFGSIEVQAREASLPQLICRCLIARVALAQRRAEFLLAQHLADEALALAQAHGLTRQKAMLYRYMGAGQLERGLPAAAETAYNQGLKEAIEARDEVLEANFLDNLGRCHGHRGNLVEGAEYANAALELTLRRSSFDATSVAQLLMRLFFYCRELGRDDEVERLFALVEELRTTRGLQWHTSDDLVVKAFDFRALEDTASMRTTLTALAENWVDRPSPRTLYLQAYLEGDLALLQGNLEEALAQFNMANRLAQASHARTDLAGIRQLQAEVLIELGRFEHAIALLQDIAAFYEFSEATAHQAEVGYLWSLLYARQGQGPAARAAFAAAAKLEAEARLTPHRSMQRLKNKAATRLHGLCSPEAATDRFLPPADELGAALTPAWQARLEGISAHVNREELDTAQSLAEQALEEQPGGRAACRLLDLLGWIAARTHRFQLAAEYQAAALGAALAQGWDDQLARLYHGIAYRHELQDRLEEAEEACDQALAYAPQSDSPTIPIAVYGQLARIRFLRGYLADAYNYAQLALASYRDQADEQGVWRQLAAVATLAAELGEQAVVASALTELRTAEATAGQGWLRALRLAAELSCALVDYDLQTIGRLLKDSGRPGAAPANPAEMLLAQRYGEYLTAIGKHAAAQDHLWHLKRVAQASQAAGDVAAIRLLQAGALIGLDDLDHASALLLDAEISYAKRLRELVRTHCAWAEYYLARNRREAAAVSLHTARQIASRLDPPGRSLTGLLDRTAALLEPAVAAT